MDGFFEGPEAGAKWPTCIMSIYLFSVFFQLIVSMFSLIK